MSKKSLVRSQLGEGEMWASSRMRSLWGPQKLRFPQHALRPSYSLKLMMLSWKNKRKEP